MKEKCYIIESGTLKENPNIQKKRELLKEAY